MNFKNKDKKIMANSGKKNKHKKIMANSGKKNKHKKIMANSGKKNKHKKIMQPQSKRRIKENLQEASNFVWACMLLYWFIYGDAPIWVVVRNDWVVDFLPIIKWEILLLDYYWTNINPPTPISNEEIDWAAEKLAEKTVEVHFAIITSTNNLLWTFEQFILDFFCDSW